jgi:hypothetical protein
MTSDPNDRATEQEEAMRENSIRNSRKAEGPKVTGRCAYCDSLLAPGLRFCDSACRSDYESEQRLLSRK